MTKHNYKQSAYYLIYLIRCVLHNKIPAKEKLDKMDLSGVFAVAKAHSLAAIASYALESAGIYDNAFEEEKNKAIRKNIILDIERERVLNEMEKAGIWYMPLKGAVLKDMFPQIGMREMADNDILFDASRSSQVKAIMESLGFTTEHFGGSNHDVYQKPPVCNFEMHNALFSRSRGEKLFAYYADVRNRLIKDADSGFGRHFSNEDFYIYITAHEHKHFSHGGTGLRNLVDRYVFLNHCSDDLNTSYIETELSKIELLDYEKKSRDIALKLFNGVKLDAEEKQYHNKYHTFDIPVSYKPDSGIALGKWIRRQRDYYANGKLTDERIERLKSIGFTLEKSDSWEEKYQLAKAYYDEHGNLQMPGNTVVNGVWLWKWLNEQKNIGLGKRKNKSLSVEQRVKLESIGMLFDHD